MALKYEQEGRPVPWLADVHSEGPLSPTMAQASGERSSQEAWLQPLTAEESLVDKLTTLNHIVETLNRAVDVHGVLDHTLAELVQLMGLESGWIFLREPAAQERGDGESYVLAAHYNLPPALDLEESSAWVGGCACQRLADDASLTGPLAGAYNEVRCSRLSRAHGDRRGLSIHASAPLRAGEEVLGILNVAAPDSAYLNPEGLSLLTNVGIQMGIALERARLYDLVGEQRTVEQAALLDLSRQLLGRRNLDELINYLVTQVRHILHADASALLLPASDNGDLEFQASSGWRGDPGAARRRVPANGSSGPGLVMRTRQVLVIEDLAEADPVPPSPDGTQSPDRAWSPDWIRAEGFRGHAVVPLLVDSRAIGVLVVNQRQPRRLAGHDLRCLSLMANQAALAIEQARLHAEEVRMRALDTELAVGRQIQLSLLPAAPPALPGWEVAAYYEPAREVGGDFYDFFHLPAGGNGQDGHLGIVVGDVTGKGVPAALFMARSAMVLRTSALGGHSPAAALQRANRLILQDRPPELLLTALYAELDPRSGRLVLASGGHLPPLWLQASTGRLQALSAPGMILAAFDEVELEEQAVEVGPNDLLVFYTDGVTEAMDADQRLFGNDRLREVVAAHAGGTAQAVLEAVLQAVRAFTGDRPQSDDLTLVVVRRSPEMS